MNSNTAFTCSGWPSSTVSSVTCGWPTGRTPSSRTALVEALRQQAVDHFLADLGGKAAPDHRLRHLAGAEAGNLGIFLIVARHAAERLWIRLQRERRAPARGCSPDSEPAHGHARAHERARGHAPFRPESARGGFRRYLLNSTALPSRPWRSLREPYTRSRNRQDTIHIPRRETVVQFEPQRFGAAGEITNLMVRGSAVQGQTRAAP